MARKILVPLDQSHAAETILPVVSAIARGDGATVRLLLVAPAPESRLNKEGRTVAYADQEMARLEAEGLDYLRVLKMRFGPVGGVECAVRFGDPMEEILREAEAFGADMIAVTTEGRGAVRRALLGSVAEQIVRKADAPVMLLRPGRSRN
jgi:nucleotide-binding universal stress UspA family protein